MRNSSWLLLGAAGFTGQLIAEQAVKQGQRPILAGRSEASLRPLAERLKLEYRVVDVTQPAQVRAALAGTGGALHAAGHFAATAPIVIEACLAAGVAYADIANEINMVTLLQANHAAAVARRIPLMTGVGFGVVASNCLARSVVDQLPDATDLQCAFHIAAAQGAPGAAATGLTLIKGGGWVVRAGKLVPYRLGRGGRIVRFADGERAAAPTPVGDLAAAFQATHVPNVTMYTTAIPVGPTALLLPVVRRLIMLGLVRQLPAPKAPNPAQPPTPPQSQAWAQARNGRGQTAEAWLEMGDGNDYAASIAALAMQRLLASDLAGALTPAEAFGPDFALSVPGTRRYDRLSAAQ